MDLPIASFLIFLPLLEAIWIFLIDHEDKTLAVNMLSKTAIWAAGINVFSVFVVYGFFISKGLTFEHAVSWFDFEWGHLFYHVGIDSIGLLFALLSTLMTLGIVLVSSHFISSNSRGFFGLLFLTQFCLFGLSFSQDLVLFLVFFELSVLPVFFMMSLWEEKKVKKPSFAMLVYILCGSTVTLLTSFYIISLVKSSNLALLPGFIQNLPISLQTTLLLLMFFSLAIKIPLWPFHHWMPDAYSESSTPVTLLLLLMKIGFFAMLRLVFPIFHSALVLCAPYLSVFLLIGIIVTSFVAYREQDIKRRLAFLSVAHMSVLVMALLSGSKIGVYGALYGYFVQTLAKGGLFLCFGYLEKQTHTRNQTEMGGIIEKVPLLGFFSTFFIFSILALPGTGVFISEFRSFTAITQMQSIIGAICIFVSVILSTIILLSTFRHVFLGPEKTNIRQNIKDFNPLTLIGAGVFAIFLFWTGISSAFLDDLINPVDTKLAFHHSTLINSPKVDSPKKETPKVETQQPSSTKKEEKKEL